MSTQTISLDNFEQIYNDTYNQVLQYIVCKCSNIENINDLIQETYMQLYKTLRRIKYLELENIASYVIGIAKKQISKYYGFLYKYRAINEMNINDEDMEIPSDIDIEASILQKLDAEKVWQYVKTKNIVSFKVFFLYFISDLKISQIADELCLTETNTKSILYRLIKDIKKNIRIEDDM